MVHQLTSLLGLFSMIGLAWLLSSHKRLFPWRVVLGGTLLQFALAALILMTPQGRAAFDTIGDFFRQLLQFVDAGSLFVFRISPRPGEESLLPPEFTLMRTFAFAVLPTIIFFSSLMAMLYHLGVMQWIVLAFAWMMRRTLGTSGAETLSAAANVFVGQTEAPLAIRPYIAQMTLSELNAVMVGGFATIAGGVLAAYVAMGIDAGHLVTASVISAPAALLIAKVIVPETEQPATLGSAKLDAGKQHVNLIEAAADGASDGLKLALNVGAMLLVFIALIAMIDAAIGWLGSMFGYIRQDGHYVWSLSGGLGLLFAPFAWLMGIPWSECFQAGELLGIRTVLNEFVAYERLAAITFSERTETILTYALCGFANFASIGIQLGGIGGIAPDRRSDLAKLGLRAMIGGTLASQMTACVAGILIPN
jgi:CNT family concentrative nucleoside transporter